MRSIAEPHRMIQDSGMGDRCHLSQVEHMPLRGQSVTGGGRPSRPISPTGKCEWRSWKCQWHHLAPLLPSWHLQWGHRHFHRPSHPLPKRGALLVRGCNSAFRECTCTPVHPLCVTTGFKKVPWEK